MVESGSSDLPGRGHHHLFPVLRVGDLRKLPGERDLHKILKFRTVPGAARKGSKQVWNWPDGACMATGISGVFVLKLHFL
jgi:hypothetical protein